jgi:phospholipase C
MFKLAVALSLVLAQYIQVSVCLPASAGSDGTANPLTKIEHIVLFMQENRAFDHVSRL